MAIVALILAVVALVCFVLAGTPRTMGAHPRWDLIPLGLAFLTAAWIAQVVVVGGARWVVR